MKPRWPHWEEILPFHFDGICFWVSVAVFGYWPFTKLGKLH